MSNEKKSPVPPRGDGGERRQKICVLLSTCPLAAAEKLATFLVKGRHAACVNIIPQALSLYRWEGKLQRDPESLLIIKCARSRVDKVTRLLARKHPYDVPEVIVLKVKGGHPPYLSWVVESAAR